MKRLLSALVILSVSALAATAQARLFPCQGYTVEELLALRPSVRIDWLTDEIADCDKTPQGRAISYINRGNAWSDLGEHERAIEDYTQAIDRNPNFSFAYNNRGNSWRLLGEYDRAIEDITKAIELDPSNTRARNHLSGARNGFAWQLYIRGEDLSEAIDQVRSAVGASPNNFYYLDTEAHILASLGRHEEAMVTFERSFTIGGSDWVRLYQEALTEKGFDPGPVDGSYGPQTRAALEAV